MPEIFTANINSSVSLSVWKIVESEEFFFSNLRLDSRQIDDIKSLKLPKRRLEKLACRQALATLLPNQKLSVFYSENGAPKMNNLQLSFSHSDSYAVAAISKENRIGVDIEQLRPKIHNLYTRFLSQQEINRFDTNSTEILQILWGAKEAAYKLYQLKSLDLSSQIEIFELTQDRGEGTIQLTNEKINFQLFHWKIEDAVLVLAVK